MVVNHYLCGFYRNFYRKISCYISDCKKTGGDVLILECLTDIKQNIMPTYQLVDYYSFHTLYKNVKLFVRIVQ